MKRIIFLICVLFSFIGLYGHPKFSTVLSSRDYYYTRADSAHGFNVLNYDLNISINASQHTITGMVEAQVLAEVSLSQIQYELVSLTVDSVKVNNNPAVFTHQNGIITINLNIPAEQNFSTKVYYHGAPVLSNDGYGNGMTFLSNQVFTVSDPNASRYWWPCYDHPWDKAIVNQHIRIRSDWKVACNGLRTQIEDHGDGTSTHHWIGSNPMATYLVCLTSADFAEVNEVFQSIPLQNFVLPNQVNTATLLFGDMPQMMEAFSEAYGPYPFEKYGNAVANISTFAAMEHQTMTTIGASYIQNNNTCKYIVAHEMAHQWFGNCLTPLTWKDVWLSESFATYSEAIYAEHQLGFEGMKNYVLSSFQLYYKNWSHSYGDQVIYDPTYLNYFTPPEYEKGASVLHMLRLTVGNTNFFNILQTYFNTYHNSNVITTEFKDICEQVSGQNLDQFFTQWIFKKGLPSFEYALFFDSNRQNAKIFIKSLTSEDSNPFYVKVPINFESTNGTKDSLIVNASPNGNVFDFSMNAGIANYEFDSNNWILYNTDTEMKPVVSAIFAANNQCKIVWNSLDIPNQEVKYNVYRSNQINGTFTKINTNPLITVNYTDTNLQNNQTYYYAITAELNGFESILSNIISGTPISFPLDQGILVVDETRDNTGSIMNPTDEMVDNFYQAVINREFTQWDIASQGLPDINVLKNYSMVIWHDDDLVMSAITENTNQDFSLYAFAGGKLMISGLKTVQNLTETFISTFTGCNTTSLLGSPLLESIQGINYPDIEVNPDMIIPNWNGNLNFVYTFSSAPNVLYKTVLSEENEYNHQPCIIYGNNVVISGLPLYYLNQTEVTSMFDQLITNWPVKNEEIVIPRPLSIDLKIYPNPVRNNRVYFDVKSAEPLTKVSLYNIKGQKVTELVFDQNKRDQLFNWDKRDSKGQSVSSGIYFLKVSNSKSAKTEKFIIFK